MSIFDEDYQKMVEAIYDSIGLEHRYNDQSAKLWRLINSDIKDMENVFHKREELTSEDLRSEELSLAVISGISDDSHSGDTIEPDTAGSEGDPTERSYPNIAKAYPHLDLDPRGARVPLYEALERYFIRLKNSENSRKGDDVIKQVLEILSEIRVEAFNEYGRQFMPPSGASPESEAKAHKYADTYLLGALNAVNISKQGTRETVKDLISRMLTQELLDAKIAAFHPENGLDYAFFRAMKTVKELDAQSKGPGERKIG